MSHTRFTVDDLPRFSPWPERLLGLNPWQQRSKSPEEVQREYEQEKWAPILQRIRAQGRPVSVDEVDEWSWGDLREFLCSIESALELMPAARAHEAYLDLILSTLRSYVPATALVELGCGYGSIILKLAKSELFRGTPVFAAEYTVSGRELLARLAAAEHLDVAASWCDFADPEITDLRIPDGAIIFTSYSVHYVPQLRSQFVTALSARRPRAVVHFEPCYEHCREGSLLGLMRRRYIEVNDYNRNLVSVLREEQDLGRIRILDEKPAVFGKNPLLPVSVVAWTPLSASAIQV